MHTAHRCGRCGVSTDRCRAADLQLIVRVGVRAAGADVASRQQYEGHRDVGRAGAGDIIGARPRQVLRRSRRLEQTGRLLNDARTSRSRMRSFGRVPERVVGGLSLDATGRSTAVVRHEIRSLQFGRSASQTARRLGLVVLLRRRFVGSAFPVVCI